jgi:hypothetical protein
VDVFEESFFGADRIRVVCEDLLSEGQDLGLHTHPAWRDDPGDSREVRRMKREESFFPQEKDFMFKCTPEEQQYLLEYGLQRLAEWGCVEPAAHRAGGYGANSTTLRLLADFGVPIDSSLHFGHPNCKISGPANAIRRMGGILEIPVTVFHRSRVYQIGWKRVVREIPYCKTDLDHCSLEELTWFLREGLDSGLPVLNLFLHSYSLLEFDSSYNRFRGSPVKEERLRRFLETAVGEPGVEVVTMREVAELADCDPSLLSRADSLPTGVFERGLRDLFWGKP